MYDNGSMLHNGNAGFVNDYRGSVIDWRRYRWHINDRSRGIDDSLRWDDWRQYTVLKKIIESGRSQGDPDSLPSPLRQIPSKGETGHRKHQHYYQYDDPFHGLTSFLLQS
jgi:hypothetical protein